MVNINLVLRSSLELEVPVSDFRAYAIIFETYQPGLVSAARQPTRTDRTPNFFECAIYALSDNCDRHNLAICDKCVDETCKLG